MTLELWGSETVGDLMDRERQPLAALAPLAGSLRFAVNQSFATRETPLQDGDEIAVLPPVSGG